MNKKHLIPWQSLLFWQTKMAKIRKLCPEIVWYIDEIAKHRLILFLHMFWYIPILILPAIIGIMFFLVKEFVLWLERQTWLHFVIWPFANREKLKDDAFYEARKILPPEEIQRRLAENV